MRLAVRIIRRPAPVDEGGGGGDPPPAEPVNIADKWMFYGDSQTGGRASGAAKSHVEAFTMIWQTDPPAIGGPTNPYNGVSGNDPSTNPNRNSQSGRSLAGTRTAYDNRTSGVVNKTTATMLWVQESGNQLGDGGSQDTVAEWKAAFKAFMIAARANSASVILVYETAFNFGRGPEGTDEDGRDWGPYNVALWEAVAELLLEEGITVYVVDTDAVIKRLQSDLVEGDIDADEAKALVWYPSSDTQRAFHYTEIGNLMIALACYATLGYDVTQLDLSGITEVSTPHKNKCLAVIAALY